MTKRPRKSAANRTLPAPAPPPAQESLPHPLTFFLRDGERRAVLAKLRGIARDRSVALCRVLGVARDGEDS